MADLTAYGGFEGQALVNSKYYQYTINSVAPYGTFEAMARDGRQAVNVRAGLNGDQWTIQDDFSQPTNTVNGCF